MPRNKEQLAVSNWSVWGTQIPDIGNYTSPVVIQNICCIDQVRIMKNVQKGPASANEDTEMRFSLHNAMTKQHLPAAGEDSSSGALTGSAHPSSPLLAPRIHKIWQPKRYLSIFAAFKTDFQLSSMKQDRFLPAEPWDAGQTKALSKWHPQVLFFPT